MKKKNFEERQLSRNLIELDILSESIVNELDLIYKELERQGRWSDFIENLDKVPAKKRHNKISDIMAKDYYECLHYALSIIEKYDEFKTRIESAERENKMKKVDKMDLPSEISEHLNSIGISTEISKEPASIESYIDIICIFYLSSTRMIDVMDKVFHKLQESKKYILL